MKRIAIRVVPVLVLLVAGVAWMGPRVSGQSSGMPSTKNGDWPRYTAEVTGNKYSPLEQITSTNFSKLEVAWRFKTDNLGPRPETKLEGTPIKVGNMVYATAGTRRAVVALNATSGEMKWMYALDEGERATRWAPRQLSGRGLSYWTDGKGDDRVVYVTTGYRLVSLNAKTGQPVAGFGQNGIVDLKQGIVIGKDKQIDLEKGEIGLHSTPLVVGDIIVVGSSMFEGLGYVYSTNAKGAVRAFDARTGKQVWRFNTIPYPGEPGNETWEGGSWEWTGNVGAWTELTADTEAGLVYLPIETPTIDEYGGNRLGDNLYAESMVAVDIKTGRKKWHYQFVHHPVWDHDMAGWGLVMDVNIDGKPRKVLSVPSKQGWLYVFDRITGQPIWPIEEKPVPASTMHGERMAKTQPFPSKPPSFSRTHITEDDLVDFTPELRAQALKNLQKFRWEPVPYVPPVGPRATSSGRSTSATPPAASTGRARGSTLRRASSTPTRTTPPSPWPSTTRRSSRRSIRISSRAKPACRGGKPSPTTACRAATRDGTTSVPQIRFGGTGGRQALAEGLDGLSILKPPYGVMAAIDVNKGDLIWRVPHGDTPDTVRNNPKLRAMNLPKTGQPGNVGVLITKTLVIAGDPQVTTPPGRGRGAMLRAYDKKTGNQVGEVLLPAPVVGHPMTYSVNGRQHIIVGVSGGNYTGEYISLRLPQTEVTTTSGRP